MFAKYIKKSGLEDLFRQKLGKQLTVIAPTTDAFYEMPVYMREKYRKDEEQLKRVSS